MSMQFKTPVPKLQRCPSCRSRRLVVAVYSLNGQPSQPVDSRTIECDACCSVVYELPRGRGQLIDRVHPSVLARETTR